MGKTLAVRHEIDFVHVRRGGPEEAGNGDTSTMDNLKSVPVSWFDRFSDCMPCVARCLYALSV
jgi:hypothetical protein